jgi:hypothetical protein
MQATISHTVRGAALIREDPVEHDARDEVATVPQDEGDVQRLAREGVSERRRSNSDREGQPRHAEPLHLGQALRQVQAEDQHVEGHLDDERPVNPVHIIDAGDQALQHRPGRRGTMKEVSLPGSPITATIVKVAMTPAQ